MADDAALEAAALQAQRAFRGHQGRKEAETVKLYAEYEAQMAEQEALRKAQMDEGMQLVKKENIKRKSERNLIAQRSFTFVEKHKASEAQRVMNMLLGTFLKAKRWLRRVRAKIKKRNEDAAAKAAAEQRREQEEEAAEQEKRKARELQRQKELEALELKFAAEQAEREAKAQESQRMVEEQAAMMEKMQQEVEAAASSSASDRSASTSPTRKKPPERSSSGRLSRSASRRSNAVGATETKASKNAKAAPKRSNSKRNSATKGKETKDDDDDTDAVTEQDKEALAGMTAKALIALQETLHAKRHRVIKKMTTKGNAAVKMDSLRANLIKINSMISKVKAEIGQR